MKTKVGSLWRKIWSPLYSSENTFPIHMFPPILKLSAVNCGYSPILKE